MNVTIHSIVYCYTCTWSVGWRMIAFYLPPKKTIQLKTFLWIFLGMGVGVGGWGLGLGLGVGGLLVGAPIWPVCESFSLPLCNRHVGRRVKCQTTLKTEVSFVRGNRSSFPLLSVYIAKLAFSFILLSRHFPLAFGPITSMVNIMRYLQPCEIAQAVQLLQNGSSILYRPTVRMSRSAVPEVYRK